MFYGENYGESAAIDVFGKQLGLPPAIGGHNNYYMGTSRPRRQCRDHYRWQHRTRCRRIPLNRDRRPNHDTIRHAVRDGPADLRVARYEGTPERLLARCEEIPIVQLANQIDQGTQAAGNITTAGEIKRQTRIRR